MLGSWTIDADDWATSDAKYKDFFTMSKESVHMSARSQVIYRIKDYDLLGPPDFHKDRLYDLLRDEIDQPWLSIEIRFTEA